MRMGMSGYCLGSDAAVMTTTFHKSSLAISSSSLSSCRISSSISFPQHQLIGKLRLRISRVLTKEENQIQLDTSSGDGGGDFGSGKGGGGGDGDGDEGIDNNDDFENNNNKNMATGMSVSQKLTLGYAALVGVVLSMAVGGVMGYVKSGSQKSLTAGGLSALLLCYVYTQLPVRPAFASSVGLGLSAALLAVMGSRFKNSGKVFPAGLVSAVSFVMAGGYLHGILRGLHT